MTPVPVLLLVYNRPETTRRAIDHLARVKPKQLFIAADGPKPSREDETKCKQVRAILADITWSCKVQRLYRKENLGLEKSISSALTWFFEFVD